MHSLLKILGQKLFLTLQVSINSSNRHPQNLLPLAQDAEAVEEAMWLVVVDAWVEEMQGEDEVLIVHFQRGWISTNG